VDSISLHVRDDLDHVCVVYTTTGTVELDAGLDRAQQLIALTWALDKLQLRCADRPLPVGKRPIPGARRLRLVRGVA
jgi:hypothetical protein